MVKLVAFGALRLVSWTFSWRVFRATTSANERLAATFLTALIVRCRRRLFEFDVLDFTAFATRCSSQHFHLSVHGHGSETQFLVFARSRSGSRNNRSFNLTSWTPITIWSRTNDDSRVAKLQDVTFIFRSVMKRSIGSNGFWKVERKMYLSYVSFRFGLQ